jgi:hypothetical protein
LNLLLTLNTSLREQMPFDANVFLIAAGGAIAEQRIA